VALNKYLQRLESLIADYRHQEFEQFENLDGLPATFEDLVWLYVDPNSGRRTRILTGRHGSRGHGRSGSDPSCALPAPYGDLIKVFVIVSLNSPLSASEAVARISSARRLLSYMQGELFEQTADSILSAFKGGRIDRVVPFVEMCERHGIMPKLSRRLRGFICYGRDRTGHGAAETRHNKLPDEKVLKALGAIFSRTILGPPSSLKSPEARIRDAVTAFMGLLCIAAPNRAAAEVPLLAVQELQSYSEGDREKVYFLDWAGSKGFGDNRNHLLSSLADKVEAGLRFFNHECEPGRILSRYYIKSNQTLGSLLGGYEIAPERAERVELDREPHLFTLGYALGFYGLSKRFPYIQTKIPGKNHGITAEGGPESVYMS
jgi:hypothetical protein